MTKKLEIQTYLSEHRRGDTVVIRWLKFDLWDKAGIRASKATIRAALAEMRDNGLAQMWGGGRSIRWHINRKQPLPDDPADLLDNAAEKAYNESSADKNAPTFP